MMYEAQYRPLMTFDGALSSMTVSSINVRMVVLTGLEEFVEYNISVRTYTSVGPGPYSKEITERTYDTSEIFSLHGYSPAYNRFSRVTSLCRFSHDHWIQLYDYIIFSSC